MYKELISLELQPHKENLIKKIILKGYVFQFFLHSMSSYMLSKLSLNVLLKFFALTVVNYKCTIF